MGGLAALARELGHEVTGSDRAAWPPMSTRLHELGIEPEVGFDLKQLDGKPDLVLVGNVMSRGMPIVEALLDSGLAFMSGPEWLGAQVLRDREVIAVTGTHGKTTTASMTAWLLHEAGLDPGYLIGGAPGNFERTARLGSGRYFVIEGDEYDTTFFDKNAKFLHYGARTVIINNIEHDHADIYADLDAVLWQFHLLLRAHPGRRTADRQQLGSEYLQADRKGLLDAGGELFGRSGFGSGLARRTHRRLAHPIRMRHR